MATVVVAWLDWQMKGDQQAGKTFIGEPCGVCSEAGWTVKRRNWT